MEMQQWGREVQIICGLWELDRGVPLRRIAYIFKHELGSIVCAFSSNL